MNRFKEDVFIAAGLRTPFGRGGKSLAGYDAIGLSVPVVQAMTKQLADRRPDLVIWGTVIPSLGWSNIAREIWLDAGLDPTVPSFSAVLACATSIAASFAAAGMIGGDTDTILVGGVETMSRPSLGLTTNAQDRLRKLFATDPAQALAALSGLTPADFNLPTKGWANRITGRTMGDHMEETAQLWGITREAQDEWALKSHQRSHEGWESGFFDDLVIALPELARDEIIRADTSLEKLASLPAAFDKTSGKGSLTAGNSSPITDGAAGVWIVSAEGRKKLGADHATARLVDFELSAVSFDDGLLMATPYGIPRLLDRNGLGFEDIAVWEIHEAFAAQALANVAALEKPGWIKEKTGIGRDFGRFPWERVNRHGGSVAIGHPFGATGARDLSQTVKELASLPKGSKAIVSVCADGGEGAVALLEAI
jgi:acetyl-CoA C-acetyltransferase/acetyl-CoA acyltransferase